MRTNSDVQNLIHSLSPTEKRYFRLYGNRHVTDGRNLYLDLFDALDRLPTGASDAAIKKALPKVAASLHLTAARHYLFGLLLDCMRQFRRNTTLVQRLASAMDDIEFLLERGLVTKAMQLLRSARKLASETGRTQASLELLLVERRIVRLVQKKNTEALLEKITAEEDELLNRLRVENEIRRLYDRMFALVREEHQLRDKNFQKKAARIAANPLIADERATLPFEAQILRLLTLADYAQLTGNAKQSHRCHKQLVRLYERHPKMVQAEPLRCINILNNYLNSCFRMRRFEEFPSVLRKMKSLSAKSREGRFQVFRNGLFLELLYMLNTKRFDEAGRLVPEIETGLARFSDRLPVTRLLSLYYNLMVLLIITEDFPKALVWINRILRHDWPDVRFDIQAAARVAMLLVHWELGHHDLLESLIRSAARFFRAHRKGYAFEEHMLRFFRDLLNETEGKDRRQVFATSAALLEKLLRENNEVLFLEETLCWIKSRATGKAMMSLLRG